jgi:hypothetical protein
MTSRNTPGSESAELTKLINNQEKLVEALRLLFDLLEAYAPMWYTEEHHKTASEALARLGCVERATKLT